LYETRCTQAFSSPERFKITPFKRSKYAQNIPVSTVFADSRNNIILCFVKKRINICINKILIITIAIDFVCDFHPKPVQNVIIITPPVFGC